MKIFKKLFKKPTEKENNDVSIVEKKKDLIGIILYQMRASVKNVMISNRKANCWIWRREIENIITQKSGGILLENG